MRQEVDVTVVGLGVMGAATLAALARRGVRAIGLERFDIPHALGSSHGGTRVIRKAYYEDPGYVPLLHRAWDAWRALESAVGETLLLQTGGLHFGAPDAPDMLGMLAAVNEHALAHDMFDRAALAVRYPQFRFEPGTIGVLEHEAGVLYAERAVMALIEVAQRAGAEVHAREPVTSLDLDGPEGVVLTTGRRTVHSRRVVLTVGPWWPENAPFERAAGAGERSAIAPPPTLSLHASRQVQFWFRAKDPDAFRPERFPVFMSYGPELMYGLPEAFYPGVKIAAHRVGATVSPETIDRVVHPEDEALVRRFLRETLPGADGPLLGARVCMYTNSADGHFALGLHPATPRVVVGTGFSGHGFKLAPAIGEILADYALDGASAATIPLFGLDRPRRPVTQA